MTTEVVDVVSGFRWPKWALIVFGIVSIIGGALALVWPGITILALVILLGIELVFWGVMLMVNAFETGQGRVLAVILGVLALIAGAMLFLQPLRNVGSVVIVLSVFWVVGGLIEAIESIVERGRNWGWELTSGLLSVAAGVVAIVWPGITLLVIAVMAGVWMIMIGLTRLFAAFSRPRMAAPAPAV